MLHCHSRELKTSNNVTFIWAKSQVLRPRRQAILVWSIILVVSRPDTIAPSAIATVNHLNYPSRPPTWRRLRFPTKATGPCAENSEEPPHGMGIGAAEAKGRDLPELGHPAILALLDENPLGVCLSFFWEAQVWSELRGNQKGTPPISFSLIRDKAIEEQPFWWAAMCPVDACCVHLHSMAADSRTTGSTLSPLKGPAHKLW